MRIKIFLGNSMFTFDYPFLIVQNMINALILYGVDCLMLTGICIFSSNSMFYFLIPGL